MWLVGQDVGHSGTEKHKSYLREAETARLLRAFSWRARTARAMHGWADRLEPLGSQEISRPGPKRAY